MSDAKWKMLNAKAEQAISRQDWFDLGLIYYDMAKVVTKEGGDAQYLRDKGCEFKLRIRREELFRLDQSSDVKAVEILCNKGGCEACRLKNGEVYSFSTALKLNPLPIIKCSNVYGCRCVYLPVIE